EIGDLALAAQAKLLRVLQEQQVQRVGSPRLYPINVRTIAATHRNLKAMIKDGRFRQDLYYRLAVVELRVPTLAERKEDLPLLQRHFVEKLAREFKKNVTGITRRAQLALARYMWPGNVRELENVIAKACMMVRDNWIDLKDLPTEVVRTPVDPVLEAL